MAIGLGPATATPSGTTLESRFVDLDSAGPADRHPGAGARAAGTIAARPRRRAEHRRAGVGLSRLAAGRPGSGTLAPRRRCSPRTTSASSPGSTRTSPPRCCTARSSSTPSPASESMACSACGTAKGPASTAPATRCTAATCIGTSAHGGVLAVSGDDHGAHSSTYPHQTEHVFQGVFIPVLNPASVQDILDLGLAGIALSRFSGLVGRAEDHRRDRRAGRHARHSIASRTFVTPDFPLPPHGLNYDPTLRFPADRTELERRVVNERIPAVLAWARANRLDRRVFGTRRCTDRHRHRRPRARRHDARAAHARSGGPPADRALQDRA